MTSQTTVKQGDTHDVTWTVNADLTGATLTGKLRLRNDTGTWTPITVTLVSASSTSSRVKHTLSGALAVGTYDLVIKATLSGVISTTPTQGFHRLIVAPNAT